MQSFSENVIIVLNLNRMGRKMRQNIGILAAVDSGKTTLAEAILYQSGAVKKMGRVDNQDAFLDHFALERARGITIFSKQAIFHWKDWEINLLDTPGHIDFSAEMERTLTVLDYAILVISGASGVQGHTKTLWKLLRRYHIPTFIFVNKLDQNGVEKENVYAELRRKLSGNIVDFQAEKEEWLDELSMCSEEMMEATLEEREITKEMISFAIAREELFPCYFGSALKLMGVDILLDAITEYAIEKEYPEEFGAIVYKITRDFQGTRLTHIKVTGGEVKNKMVIGEEKVNQIRIYNGVRFESVSDAGAGTVCALVGLNHTYVGQSLGEDHTVIPKVLEPVLSYEMILPEDIVHNMVMPKLKEMAEEFPELQLQWDEKAQSIRVKLMGAVQIEILQNLFKERMDMDVTFSEGSIAYKETIQLSAEGIGHFEPLRHYAEVHLLLEPLPRGSGLIFLSKVSSDMLAVNWQNLILTHLKEREHKGVLIGAPITDMRMTIVAGRAHNKHTEGGDFCQATYRAVRQGLMQTESILLEPYYEFRLEIPAINLGRALNDLNAMFAKFDPPETEEEMASVVGVAPVACIQNYQAELLTYTKGQGHIFLSFDRYDECHNSEEVIANAMYDPELDISSPCGSVFCAYGSGFYVPWYEVPLYRQVDSGLGFFDTKPEDTQEVQVVRSTYDANQANTEELMEIFERTYGKVKPRIGDWDQSTKHHKSTEKEYVYKGTKKVKEYMLVDGYNVIFAWDSLRELAEQNIDAARDRLMDILVNYSSYQKYTLILVFDAYKLKGHTTEIMEYHNIYVVYTKEAETADRYIEKTAHEIGHKYRVTVVTSDGMEQVIIRSAGCILMSSKELFEDVQRVEREIRKEHIESQMSKKNLLFDQLSDEMKQKLEDIRLGK